MCCDVLELEADFTKVETVRPRGGRDGGKDLVAVFRGNEKARGGIGFKASADDSHRTWAAKKFRDDLTSALADEPDLAAFVFFTNVDLPPSDVTTLEKAAAKKGVEVTRIFHRERLREVLDSPTGLFLRLRYLKLPMTEEEQLAFFERYGSELQEMVRGGFSAMASRFDSVDFIAARGERIDTIEFLAHLKRARRLDQLGTCGVAVFSMRPDSVSNRNTLHLAYVSQLEIGAQPLQPPGIRTPPPKADPMVLRQTGRNLAWYIEQADPPVHRKVTPFVNAVDAHDDFPDVLWTTARPHDQGPLKTLSDFNRRHYSIWLTAGLLSEVQAFSFCVNEYRLFRLPLAAFDVERVPHNESRDFQAWDDTITPHLREQQWVALSLRRTGGGHFYNVLTPGALTTDFGTYTPSKFVNRPNGD